MDQQPSTSIWVWAAWLESKGGLQFVYGCAAECAPAEGWRAQPQKLDLPGATLLVEQTTVENAEYRSFADQLSAGKLVLAAIFGEALPDVPIREARQVIQAGLGQTAARVTTYYTLPDLSALFGDDECRAPLLLEVLEAELGLPFRESHAARLGNFEWFDLHLWLDGEQPFLIEADSVNIEGGAGVYTVSRTAEFAAAEQKAHIVGTVNGDVVIDRLVTLPTGERRTLFDVPDRLDALEFALFDIDGCLLHSQKGTFINRVGLVLAPIHRQIRLEDQLSNRESSGRKRPSVVTAHSSIRSQVGAPKAGSWRKYAEDVAHAVALHTPKPSEDRWFPRGIEGELGAIAHLNKMLDGGAVRRAVIADPWFGVDALRQFAMRLSSTDVEIAILTSWLDKDPDSGSPLDPVAPTAKLEMALDEARLFINPKLELLNLIDGTDRAFHDRYLLLYPHEGLSKVFLLSNSLNGASRNWPFSFSHMGGDAVREVRLYLEGLHAGKDITRDRQLQINLRWNACV